MKPTDLDAIAVPVSLGHVRRLIYLLVAVALVCLVATALYDFVDGYPEVLNFLVLHPEASVPTWISALLLALGAVLAWCNYATVKRRGGASRVIRGGWLFLVVLFVGLSADESAMIHERVGSLYHALTTSGQLSLPPGWFLSAYAPLIVVSVLFMLCFFYTLRENRKAAALAYAGLAIWVASIGFEKLDGFRGSTEREPLFILVRYATEYCELIGTAVMCRFLIEHLGFMHSSARVEPAATAVAAPRSPTLSFDSAGSDERLVGTRSR